MCSAKDTRIAVAYRSGCREEEPIMAVSTWRCSCMLMAVLLVSAFMMSASAEKHKVGDPPSETASVEMQREGVERGDRCLLHREGGVGGLLASQGPR